MAASSEPIPTSIAPVAVCALLSVIACLSLFAYVGWNRVVVHITARNGDVRRQARARKKLRFLRSQFGALLISLLVSDCIQAAGFATDLHWVLVGAIKPHSKLCTFQAIAIQVGDTAGAFWILACAVYTMVVLFRGHKPPQVVLLVVSVLIWGVVVLLAVIGPLAIQTRQKGPFYTQAGAWCWIGSEYKDWRLVLHYSFLFVAAAGSVFFYAAAILSLRLRVHSGISDVLSSSQSRDASSDVRTAARRRLSTSTTSSTGSRPARISADGNINHSAQARVRSAARKMTAYPVVYLTLVLPLTIFRLVQFAGHEPPFSAQIAVGSIFTLSGLANTLLWGFTRGLFSLRRARREVVPPAPSSTKKEEEWPAALGFIFSQEMETKTETDDHADQKGMDRPMVRRRIDSDATADGDALDVHTPRTPTTARPEAAFFPFPTRSRPTTTSTVQTLSPSDPSTPSTAFFSVASGPSTPSTARAFLLATDRPGHSPDVG